MSKQKDFPLFRITLVGSADSGKTSVINSFVNNTCPPNYIPTIWPQLYYKVVRLPPEGSPESKLSSFCVEIEDSFSSIQNDEQKNNEMFFDMKRTTISVPSGVNDFSPFNIWKVPFTPYGPLEKYHPITQGRMGMMIVFDSNSKESFEEAMVMYLHLNDLLESKADRLRPVIFLVANKIDKDPSSEEFQSLVTQAEIFSQKQFLRLWKVSALTCKNIKKMFNDMIYLIQGNIALWQLEVEEESEEEEEEDACTIM